MTGGIPNGIGGLPEGWRGDEVAMVFDGESGNAIDCFDYTAEELEARAKFMRGDPVVTIEPNSFGAYLA